MQQALFKCQLLVGVLLLFLEFCIGCLVCGVLNALLDSPSLSKSSQILLTKVSAKLARSFGILLSLHLSLLISIELRLGIVVGCVVALTN